MQVTCHQELDGGASYSCTCSVFSAFLGQEQLEPICLHTAYAQRYWQHQQQHAPGPAPGAVVPLWRHGDSCAYYYVPSQDSGGHVWQPGEFVRHTSSGLSCCDDSHASVRCCHVRRVSDEMGIGVREPLPPQRSAAGTAQQGAQQAPAAEEQPAPCWHLVPTDSEAAAMQRLRTDSGLQQQLRQLGLVPCAPAVCGCGLEYRPRQAGA